MTSTSKITVAELVSLEAGKGINFTGIFPPTFNGAPFGSGAPGANGLNNATVMLFNSTTSSTPPTLPLDPVVYTFATGAATGATGGWSTAYPNNTDQYKWVTKYVAISTDSTYTIQPSDWSAASIMARDGTSGYNTARLYIYQRLTEGQTPASPNANTTYTFSTNELTGLTNGWLYLIPLGSDPLWVSSATATSYSSSDVITPVEWSTPVILVKNGSSGSKGDTGSSGAPGDKSVTVNLYTWSTSTPTAPTGTTTYTWASGVHSGNIGVWYTTVQSNPGTPGLRLWSITKTITVPSSAVTSSVSWNADAVSPIGENGSGFRTVEASVFKWSATLPSGPIGTGTYDWTGSAVTADPTSSPGWHIVANNSDMNPGFTLWKASVFVQDSLLVNQTSFNWTGASIVAVGYAGAQGPSGSTDLGAQGASARIAYKKYSSGTSPSNSPDPYTIAGDTLPPANTWDGTGVSWSTTVPTLGSNEFLYQANGTFNPATNQTAWSAPYQTSFKVGALSALTANMGTITSGNITLDTSGFIRTAGASYGSGSGIWMGYTGGTYKISIGGLTYDGTTLSVPAASITGQLSAGQINTNGLTIRDASGNVILGAGASVNPSSYMNVPAGWQNSNLALSSTGTLTSSGTTLGSVTATGIGAVQTSLANAPSTILNSNISLTQSGSTYSLNNAGSSSTISIGGLGYTGDLNATSDLPMVLRGGITQKGGTLTKNIGAGAGNAWNSDARSIDSFTGGVYVIASPAQTNMAVMFGINKDPDTDSGWQSLDYAWYFDEAGVAQIAKNGVIAASMGAYSAGQKFAVTYDGTTVRWLKTGNVVYTETVTISENMYMDTSFFHEGASLTGCRFGPMTSNNWAAVGGSGKPQDNATVGATLGTNVRDSAGNVVTTEAVKNNLIDLGWWKSNASIPWTQNGEVNTLGSAAIWGVTDPKGGSDVVWHAREITGDGQNGGGWESPGLNLDINKTYRFVLPVRAISGDGTIYWSTSSVCTLNTTTALSNDASYFKSWPKNSMYTDRWYLLVGYVYPYNTTGFTHAGSGILDCSTGLFLSTGINFNFSNSGNATHRAYQFYASGTGAQTIFGKPVINLVDGSEPPLSSFFANSALLNQSISVSNSGNAYSINGIGSTGSINISGLGYRGDLDATRGAPTGTPVGSSDATTVSSAAVNYTSQTKSFPIGGSRDTFYPVLISANGTFSGATYYDITVFRSDVHMDSTNLSSYSCNILARSSSYGHAYGKLIEVNQASGLGTYPSGVAAVYPHTASNGILVYMRGGMTHLVSVGQPIGPYTVNVYLSGYNDPMTGLFSPISTGPLLSYLDKAYKPDSPVEWSSSIGGSAKPQDNATVGAPSGTPVAGTFPGGTSASSVESNASTALTNANNALNNRLAKSGADILTGPITLNAASAILVGTTNDGLYLGNTGIVGRKDGATTFAVDQAGNATFGGALNAATGTFAGNLQAAGGTFSGNLQAAGGTFSGNLQAAGGNFSGTLNARVIVTDNIISGQVTDSASVTLTGSNISSGSAANFRSGTITGPSQTLYGGKVKMEYSGSLTIQTNGNTSLLAYHVRLNLKLVPLFGGGSSAYDQSHVIDFIYKLAPGSTGLTFLADLSMFYINPVPGAYRTDMDADVYCFDPATGSGVACVTGYLSYGYFSIQEFKV